MTRLYKNQAFTISHADGSEFESASMPVDQDSLWQYLQESISNDEKPSIEELQAFVDEL